MSTEHDMKALAEREPDITKADDRPVMTAEMPVFVRLLQRWMRLADKSKYDKPKDWPA